MDIRLSPQQQQMVRRLSQDLDRQGAALAEAYDQYRSRVEQLHAEIVAPALAAYNAELESVRALIREWAGEWHAQWKSRPVAWRESSHGDAVSEWIWEWESWALHVRTSAFEPPDLLDPGNPYKCLYPLDQMEPEPDY